MVYPLRCEPIYQTRVWGGRWFAQHWGRDLPDDQPYGESWELSCRADAMSQVTNGPGAGRTLHDLFRENPVGFLGTRNRSSWLEAFPLLIKYLDANDNLSIQVHPNSEWAIRKQTKELGKSEMWYVLDAKPQARLLVGLAPGVTQDDLRRVLAAGEGLDAFHTVPVRKGDAVYIPSGTVHAILGGVRLAEIQQNSDTTYRLYDWGRVGLDGKPRPLHVNDALEVIDYTRGPISPKQGLVLAGGGWKCRLLVACPHFAVEEMHVKELESRMNAERFEVWMILKGKGRLSSARGAFFFQEGETWLIPAALGHYSLRGNLHFLKAYVPDLEGEILHTLRMRGYGTDDLHSVGGLTEIE